MDNIYYRIDLILQEDDDTIVTEISIEALALSAQEVDGTGTKKTSRSYNNKEASCTPEEQVTF